MNKTLLYVVIGIVVVGGVALMVMNRPNLPGVVGSNSQSTSLRDLIASGSPQKCTFDEKTTGAESSGEVYVSNGKMRGNFTSSANGQSVESHMIVQESTAYVWTNTTNQGVKMSFEGMIGNQENHGAVDVNQQLNYSCTPWSEDTTAFSLPSEITFADMSGMMNQMMGKIQASGSVSTGNQCGACDSIPDANAKAQCRAALNCK